MASRLAWWIQLYRMDNIGRFLLARLYIIVTLTPSFLPSNRLSALPTPQDYLHYLLYIHSRTGTLFDNR